MCAPSAPPPPDYVGAAQAQGQANLQAGQQTTLLNNPNIVTPFGTQTYDPGPDVFDQTGYDGAMAQYNTELAAYNAAPTFSTDGDTGQSYQNARPQNPDTINRADYTTPSLRGTITQNLSAGEQGVYDQSLQNRGLLGGLATQGATALQGVIGRNLDLSRVSPRGEALDLSRVSPSGQALDLSSVSSRGEALDLSRVSPSGQALDLSRVSPSGQALDLSRVSPRGEAFQSSSAEGTRQRVIDAMMSRADTRLGQQAEQTNADLIARGLRPGTEAYTREQDALGRQRNDAFQQAQIAGGDAAAQQGNLDLALQGQQFGQTGALRAQDIAAQAQQFGQADAIRARDIAAQGQQFSQTGALRAQDIAAQEQQFGQTGALRAQDIAAQAQQFGQTGALRAQDIAAQAQQFGQADSNRRQQIAELLAQRQTPLNEIAALMSGSQVNNPFAGGLGFQGGANVGAAPLANATQQQGQWAQNQYAQDVGQSNAMMSGLFGLGGAALGGRR